MSIPKALACPYQEKPTAAEVLAFRKKMHWTQSDVALLLGVSTKTPSFWETGRAKMQTGLWELMHIKARVLYQRAGALS